MGWDLTKWDGMGLCGMGWDLTKLDGTQRDGLELGVTEWKWDGTSDGMKLNFDGVDFFLRESNGIFRDGTCRDET